MIICISQTGCMEYTVSLAMLDTTLSIYQHRRWNIGRKGKGEARGLKPLLRIRMLKFFLDDAKICKD